MLSKCCISSRCMHKIKWSTSTYSIWQFCYWKVSCC